MIRGRAILLTVVLLLSSVLAFFIRETIHDLVILPLAYLWWVAGLYYQLIPQVILWIGLILIGLITVTRTLLDPYPRDAETTLPERVQTGPIEALSGLLDKTNKGIYYKWLIANRLGRLVYEWLYQREGMLSGRRIARIVDRNWNPPDEIGRYLEAGLNGSFADYPRARWGRRKATPLDISPRRVVDYLKSEMEVQHRGNR